MMFRSTPRPAGLHLAPFDPLQPRSYSGETTTIMVGDVEVRVTGPVEGELPGLGADVGFTCGDWVWLLEPTINGTADETVETARVIIESAGC